MTRFTIYSFVISSILIIAAVPPGIDFNNTGNPEPPPGFYLNDSSIGWRLYRKDYPKGNPDFVQVLNLEEGASIKLLHGEIAKSGEDRGAYGGDNPKFLSRPLSEFWWDTSRNDPQAVCVFNGGFFYLPEHPTKLAFPLKVEGEILTDGFGIDQYPWNKLILEIWDDKVDIRRLSRWSLQTSSAPDIISGLSEEANKKKKNYTGRTFIGVDDQDSDGDFETVIVFNTLTARQIDAAEVLRSFGAEKVMMLDGGGSTQLTCKGDAIVKSERLIPQAIAVSRGEGPLFSGILLNQDEAPIIVEGDYVVHELEIMNTGADSWRPGETYLMVDNSPWSKDQIIPFEERILPGNRTVVNWKIIPSAQKGANNSTLFLFRENQKYPLENGSMSVIIMPRTLGSKLVSLEKFVNNWALESNLDQDKPKSGRSTRKMEVRSSNTEKTNQSAAKAVDSLATILIIPSSILVFSSLLFFRIQKKNQG